MDDATYAFVSDVHERKQLVPSARKVKNGSRSKKCTLPSDYLTKGQLKRMNSEIITYKMNVPMDWKSFKAMPLNIQEEYLSNLVDKYNVRLSHIGCMFGVTGSTVNKYIKDHNFSSVKIYKRGSSKISSEDLYRWSRFIHVESESRTTDVENVVVDATCNNAKSMKISNLNVSFEGSINLNDIVAYLKLTLGNNIEGHMEISFHE